MQTDPSHSQSAGVEGGSVVALWRYPVKSMMGEELNATEVTERGLVGIDSSPLSTRRTGRSRARRTRASGEISSTFTRPTSSLQGEDRSCPPSA